MSLILFYQNHVKCVLFTCHFQALREIPRSRKILRSNRSINLTERRERKVNGNTNERGSRTIPERSAVVVKPPVFLFARDFAGALNPCEFFSKKFPPAGKKRGHAREGGRRLPWKTRFSPANRIFTFRIRTCQYFRSGLRLPREQKVSGRAYFQASLLFLFVFFLFFSFFLLFFIPLCRSIVALQLFSFFFFLSGFTRSRSETPLNSVRSTIDENDATVLSIVRWIGVTLGCGISDTACHSNSAWHFVFKSIPARISVKLSTTSL